MKSVGVARDNAQCEILRATLDFRILVLRRLSTQKEPANAVFRFLRRGLPLKVANSSRFTYGLTASRCELRRPR